MDVIGKVKMKHFVGLAQEYTIRAFFNNCILEYESPSATGGGTWYTGSTTSKNIIQTQTFTYSNPIDLNVDVTNTVDIWFSQSNSLGGDIPNEGFIIKQTSSVEFIPSQSQASHLNIIQ